VVQADTFARWGVEMEQIRSVELSTTVKSKDELIHNHDYSRTDQMHHALANHSLGGCQDWEFIPAATYLKFTWPFSPYPQ